MLIGGVKLLKKFSDTIETISGKYGEKDIFILRNSTTEIDVSLLYARYFKG